jgi:uncharacterized protein (DUF58 family)
MVFVGPRGRRGPVEEAVALLPLHRGVFDSIELDVASAAPFALQWWTRRIRLPLPSTLHVSPRCGRPEPISLRPDEGSGDMRHRPRADQGLPRGARPYLPGDSQRLVHWRATAHAGRLMVRELESPAAEAVTITVELPGDPEAAERVTEAALGSVVRLLGRGVPVLLATTEASGPVLAAVGDRRRAGRRLARAVTRSGPGMAPPDGGARS